MPHRLSAADTAFLHLEEQAGAHQHVACGLVLEGEPPTHDELIAHVEERLPLTPRYRQRLAFVPYRQGRPVWIDDPHFQTAYHVRHTALPKPGGTAELRRLAGRVFSQELDRTRPLWELWLVEGLKPSGGRPRFGVLCKTHHALVDGVGGTDVTRILFDTVPDPPAIPPAPPWVPRPVPSDAQLLADALLERATVPAEFGRGVRALVRAPLRAAEEVGEQAARHGLLGWAGVRSAPASPINGPISPHRRCAWRTEPLDTFRRIKLALGGTVNDAVVTVVALALGQHLRASGVSTRGLELQALVPVSVRPPHREPGDDGPGDPGIEAIYTPLPVEATDPVTAFGTVHEGLASLSGADRVIGAQALTELDGLAPPTIMVQAARLQARERHANLVITNVPGPQMRLFLLGRPLVGLYPLTPLGPGRRLSVAVMSYHGRLSFGLNADYDSIPDVDGLATAVGTATAELADAAGAGTSA